MSSNPGATKDVLEFQRNQDLKRVDKEAKDYANLNRKLGEDSDSSRVRDCD